MPRIVPTAGRSGWRKLLRGQITEFLQLANTGANNQTVGPLVMAAGSATSAIQTIKDLQSLLLLAWRADTSLVPVDWSADNPGIGQCAVTALVVQDLFGGELLRGRTNGGTHYWNLLPSGVELDLTACQFEMKPWFFEVAPSSREYVLSFEATRERYQRLRKNLRL